MASAQLLQRVRQRRVGEEANVATLIAAREEHHVRCADDVGHCLSVCALAVVDHDADDARHVRAERHQPLVVPIRARCAQDHHVHCSRRIAALRRCNLHSERATVEVVNAGR